MEVYIRKAFVVSDSRITVHNSYCKKNFLVLKVKSSRILLNSSHTLLLLLL